MKMRLLRGVPGIFLLFTFVLILAACGRGGGGGGRPAIPLTTIPVDTQLDDIVGFSEFNAYAATVTPGALYKISITNLSDDADLLVYGADSTFTAPVLCPVDNSSLTGASNEDCIMASPGGTLYFAVDGAFLSASTAAYTISIESVPFTNLGLSIPLTDVVNRTGAAAYSVPAFPGAFHTIAITGLSDDADLYIFGNDGSFSATVACFTDNTLFTGTTSEDCTLFSDGGTLFFIVDGLFSSAAAVQYTTFATPAPAVPSPGNEGIIGNPVLLSGGIPSIGQVGFAGESFYAVTGLTPGARYTVSITGLSGDAHLNVYGDDFNFVNLAFCLTGDNTGFQGTTAESCTVLLSGNTLHFSVTANTASGGVAFINLVTLGP